MAATWETLPMYTSIFFALIFAMLSCSQPLLAEVVRLKNGTVLHGSIVQMTETDLTLETADMGQMVVKRRTIQSFEDDTPATPSAPIVVNNNTVTATESTPPDSPPPASPAPVMSVATAPDEEDQGGVVFGSINGGVGFLRMHYGKDLADATWSRAVPMAHWDFIGYRWRNGLTLMSFGEGTQKDRHPDFDQQWMQGGLRLDAAFGSSRNRFGTGNFYAGLGATYFHATQASRYTSYSTDYNWDNSAFTYPYETTVNTKFRGHGFLAQLGYQTLSNSGFGVNAGVGFGQGRIDQGELEGGVQCYEGNCDHRMPNMRFQTLSVTAGLAYAL